MEVDSDNSSNYIFTFRSRIVAEKVSCQGNCGNVQ